MPQTSRKKSTASTWFNRVIRETLVPEYVYRYRVTEGTEYHSVQSTRAYRVPECTEYQSVQSTRISECTEYQSVTVDSLRLYPSLRSKESDTEPDTKYTKATGGNHLPAQKKIARVQAMLEKSKKIDETQRYMEQLNELVIAGRANLSTYAEISKSE